MDHERKVSIRNSVSIPAGTNFGPLGGWLWEALSKHLGVSDGVSLCIDLETNSSDDYGPVDMVILARGGEEDCDQIMRINLTDDEVRQLRDDIDWMCEA